MHMPEMDGLDVHRAPAQAASDVKTIILSAFADRARVDDALGRGADAYVAKSIKPAALADLLRRVHAGESFDAGVEDAAPSAGERAGPTERETEILAALAQGLPNRRRSAQALDHRADGEVPPDEHLSQARRREPHRRCSLRVRERAQRVTYGDRELALLEIRSGDSCGLLSISTTVHCRISPRSRSNCSSFGTQMAANADRLVLGRVDDFAARVDAIERELRTLAHSLSAPALTQTPLAEPVRSEVEALESAGVRVTHEIHGSVEWFTPSLRIALIRLVQAAFENIRLHSGAHAACLTITSEASRVRLEIVDDGEGFEVERRSERRHAAAGSASRACASASACSTAAWTSRAVVDRRRSASSCRAGAERKRRQKRPGRPHLLPVKAAVAPSH